MTDIKVSFYLKKDEEKADGTAPILGRIRIGKSMAQFSARTSVPLSLWDTPSGRAVGKSKTALSVNASLDGTNRLSAIALYSNNYQTSNHQLHLLLHRATDSLITSHLATISKCVN